MSTTQAGPIRSFCLRLACLSLFLTITLSACRDSPAGISVVQSPTSSLTTLPAATISPTPAPGVLSVDASQELGPIRRGIFGSNYGPWLFIPLDMQPLAKEAGISIMRFPGGNWGDLNDIEEWQIDQLITLCKTLGCEPSLNVRLKGGTPEKAAALVELVNKKKNLAVRYWAIGNEPDLYPDYSIEQFNQDWRRFAQAMKAVDPTIQLIGPELSQVQPPEIANPYYQRIWSWLVEFLKANGDLVDIVSIHRYPFPADRNGSPPTIAELSATAQEWDLILPAMRQLIHAQTGRDLPLAITEINSSWASNSGGKATMDSNANAVWWAGVLGKMINHRVEIVNQFAIIGEYGLMDKHTVYPIYHVYPLYRKFGDQLVPSAVDHPDLVITAARGAGGVLTLMVVNLSQKEISYPLTIHGFTPSGPPEVWRLDTVHAVGKIAPADLPAGEQAPPFTLTLPGQSVTLYSLPGE